MTPVFVSVSPDLRADQAVVALLTPALRRLRVDPAAIVSAPLISMLVGGAGLMTRFTDARVILGL